MPNGWEATPCQDRSKSFAMGRRHRHMGDSDIHRVIEDDVLSRLVIVSATYSRRPRKYGCKPSPSGGIRLMKHDAKRTPYFYLIRRHWLILMNRTPTTELISEIRAVCQHIAHALRRSDLLEHTDHSEQTFKRRFGSLKSALEAADIPHIQFRENGPT